ncbi:MAG: DUF6493 family protein, partial [Bacteroidota bacterium]
MRLIENWINLVETHNEKAIIPYLQALDEAQKHTLLTTIGRVAKAYLEVKDRLINGKHFYAKKASNKQERIILYSILFCLPNLKHPLHKWLNTNRIITPFVVNYILPWYCPDWWEAYIDQLNKSDFIPLPIRYELVVKMVDLGYIQPNKSLITKLLPRLIFQEKPEQKYVYLYEPNALLTHPNTLAKHLWWLFDYPSQIYQVERHLNLEDRENLPKNCWYDALKKLVDNGQIDRLRLLESSLNAATKPIFNKLAVGWFAGLFEKLSPTEGALIQLQPALFATFSLPYSKMTNTALKYVKKIADHSDFLVEECLTNFKNPLQSLTKSVVTNALRVLEKLAKKHRNKRIEICQLASYTFSQREAILQKRAAKILQLYGQENKAKIKAALTPFLPNLFASTQEILADFKLQKVIPQLAIETTPFHQQERLSAANQIPTLTTFEDFLALALNVFDNRKIYHFDQFLAGLLQFQTELQGANIEKLTPLFKKAFQLVYNELPSNQGMLDSLLGIFLMDLGDFFMGKYPSDSTALKDIAKTYLEQGFFLQEVSTTFELQYAHLSQWYNPYDPSEVYTPFKLLLSAVLGDFHQQKRLPLLSTPTHSPIWLDPTTLVKRLAIYQNQQKTPNAIDLQLAISRLAFEQTEKAMLVAKEKLHGKYLDLATFLFQPTAALPTYVAKILTKQQTIETHQENGHFTSLTYGFITAAITKNAIYERGDLSELPSLQLHRKQLTGDYRWMAFWETQRHYDWNHKTSRLEFVGEPFVHTELHVKFPKGQNAQSHPDFLYQYFPGNDQAFRPNFNDMQRLLGMLPNNPAPLLALLIADNLKYPTFWEEAARKRVQQMVEWLENYTYQTYDPMTHLLLASGMFCGDKKIRLQIADIWKAAVTRQQVDSEKLGTFLGKMERQIYAPLQRFTELAQQELFGVSNLHDQALEQMVVNLLGKLPALPIKGLSKLLVLYRELLATNRSKIDHERLLTMLGLWKNSPSFK